MASTPLYCNRCHTRWVEGCVGAGMPCPFVDCDGRLTFQAPGPPPAPKPKPAPKTYPLFRGAPVSQWWLSHRADPAALPLADRHYNRQKIGSPQFVPPGRCLVLLTAARDALWVSSFPIAAYVRHAWAGAWVNSLFRSESDQCASALIVAAVAATRAKWDVPALGMVTFVDPAHVRPTMRRGRAIYGYSYLKAGFRHVGFTKGGLWAWQLHPEDMPPASAAVALNLFADQDRAP